MQPSFTHINYLKLKDVSNILGLKDDRSAKKWLHDNGVPISKTGRDQTVDQFIFDLKRQQLRVEELKKCYPNKWFEIYSAKTEDKAMVEAIRALYPMTRITKIKKNNNIPKFIE